VREVALVPGGEDDLVGRARRGDERAWAQLYDDHAGRLVLWLRQLPHLDPAADAEDVAAEAWLTAAVKLERFTGDRDDFGGWLFGIARNVARRRHRTACSRATTALVPEHLDAALLGRSCAPATAADDVARDVAGADLARRLVARLPAREAEVVTCLDVVGLDMETTCRALDLNAGAVRVARMRGLRRLRTLLGVRRALSGSSDGVTRAAARGM
jgi:RNA polymerase sigma-70 factor (ECF subfamily)